MIKMIIQMDEGRILTKSEYTPSQIYETINKVFNQQGFTCTEKSGVREYCGKEDARDFGRFSRIYNMLKRQPWFMDNAMTWLLLNSDDSDDPNDFSEEDLLAYNRRRAAIGA
ncbi:MAG: hypothetical protein J6D57_00405 [Mogibacterium sp.]|nr:hypothetical protein [Mogibacterium sp.]